MKSKSPSQGWVLNEATKVYLVHPLVLCHMFIFTRMQFPFDWSKFHVSFWWSLSWKTHAFLVTSPTQTWKIIWDAVHSPSPWCTVLSKTGHVRRCTVICPLIGWCTFRKTAYFSSIWSWTFSSNKTIIRQNLSDGFLTGLANWLKSPVNESKSRDGA